MSKKIFIKNEDFNNLYKPNYKLERLKEHLPKNYFQTHKLYAKTNAFRNTYSRNNDKPINEAYDKAVRHFDFERILSQYTELLNTKRNTYTERYLDKLTDLLKDNDKNYNIQRRVLNLTERHNNSFIKKPLKCDSTTMFYFHRDLNNKRLQKFRKLNRIKSEKIVCKNTQSTEDNELNESKNKQKNKTLSKPNIKNKNKEKVKRVFSMSDFAFFRNDENSRLNQKERILDQTDKKFYKYDVLLKYNKKRIFNNLSNQNNFFIPKEQRKRAIIDKDILIDLLSEPTIELNNDAVARYRKRVCQKMQRAMSYTQYASNHFKNKIKQNEENNYENEDNNENNKEKIFEMSYDKHIKTLEQKDKLEKIELNKRKINEKIQKMENDDYLKRLVMKNSRSFAKAVTSTDLNQIYKDGKGYFNRRFNITNFGNEEGI